MLIRRAGVGWEYKVWERGAIDERCRTHLKVLRDRGYEVVFLALQGSQNYGLDEYSDDYQSDVDTKAIVLPSFEDILFNRAPVSTTIVLDNNEHIDVKDIRVMFEMFKKENVSYIELLFSKYQYVNPKYREYMEPILCNPESVAAADLRQFVKCLAGMSMEKEKALCHPYPGIIDKIEKYGYDGKQLSHCARLNRFIKLLDAGFSLEYCYGNTDRQLLMNYKKQLDQNGDPLSAAAAQCLCAQYNAETQEIKDKMLARLPVGKEQGALAAAKYNILKKKFKEDLRHGLR